MTTRHACKICVLTRGITLRDTFATEAELAEHIAKEHAVLTTPSAHRWNVEPQPDGSLLVCRGDHDRNAACVFERFDRQQDRCFTLPNGECVSPFPCVHGAPHPQAVQALLALEALSETQAPSPLFARGRSDTGRVPVAEATRLCQNYGLVQVIIVAWDGKQEHVTTEGSTLGDADNAAEGGNLVKRALNWPPDRYATSGRVDELLRRVRTLLSLVDPDAVPECGLREAKGRVEEAMREGWRL